MSQAGVEVNAPVTEVSNGQYVLRGGGHGNSVDARRIFTIGLPFEAYMRCIGSLCMMSRAKVKTKVIVTERVVHAFDAMASIAN
ncbi:hypothetical protein L1987_08504 [Smallanthus sonchifolius]|uniref:Uncharacterized protein n=1 Tax=Smallanthus sonchifolius TaxID=185202 RepID=A0ACB9JKV4_9ASTR|nr:hypothetical protein L1987_08504 [Smallanthus sonchifolius]